MKIEIKDLKGRSFNANKIFLERIERLEKNDRETKKYVEQRTEIINSKVDNGLSQMFVKTQENTTDI